MPHKSTGWGWGWDGSGFNPFGILVPGTEFEYADYVIAIDGATYTIGPHTLVVDEGTEFVPNQESIIVGSYVEVEGIVDEDSSFRATKITLEVD